MIYVIAPSIWGLIDLPWMSASIFQPTHLAVSSVPSYNTPPCEAPMPFLICSYRRFPVCCPVPYYAGPFFKFASLLFGFWVSSRRQVCNVPISLSYPGPYYTS